MTLTEFIILAFIVIVWTSYFCLPRNRPPRFRSDVFKRMGFCNLRSRDFGGFCLVLLVTILATFLMFYTNIDRIRGLRDVRMLFAADPNERPLLGASQGRPSRISPLYMEGDYHSLESGDTKDTRRKIPRIIHQICKSRKIPREMTSRIKTWREHMPNWEYWLWTEADADFFIRTKFPSFYAIYRNYPTEVHRLNAARYFILFEFGGVYADLNVKALRSLESLTSDHFCILPQVSMFDAVTKWRVDHLFSDSVVASSPGHPLMKLIIEQLEDYFPSGLTRDPAETTGSLLITCSVSIFERLHMNKFSLSDTVYLAPVGSLIPRKDAPEILGKFCRFFYWKRFLACQVARTKHFKDKPYNGLVFTTLNTTFSSYNRTFNVTIESSKIDVMKVMPSAKNVTDVLVKLANSIGKASMRRKITWNTGN